MTDTTELEITLMIDGDGNYVVDKDPDNIGCRWEEEEGSTPNVCKVVTLKLTVPLPKPATVSGAIPDTDGPVNITIS